MYWTNIKALKIDLSSGNYQERDIVPYIIADGILTALFSIGGSDTAVFDVINVIIGIVIIIVGTWYVFGQHQPNSQASFLTKYISLSWVVGFRLLIITIPLIIIGVFLTPLTAGTPLLYGYGILIGVLYAIIYYLLLGKHISEV